MAATIASILLAWIGLTFSAAMTLTASPEIWPAIFMASTDAGAVTGVALHVNGEALLRFFVMLGISFGTLAAFLALDGEFFTANAEYCGAARRLVMPLYLLGLVIFALAGVLYAPTVREKLPGLTWYAAGAGMPIGAVVAMFYRKQASRAAARLLVGVQVLTLVLNAFARQSVQVTSLASWAKLEKMSIRGDWDSFGLFVVVLLVVVRCLGWLLRLIARAPRLAGHH